MYHKRTNSCTQFKWNGSSCCFTCMCGSYICGVSHQVVHVKHESVHNAMFIGSLQLATHVCNQRMPSECFKLQATCQGEPVSECVVYNWYFYLLLTVYIVNISKLPANGPTQCHNSLHTQYTHICLEHMVWK